MLLLGFVHDRPTLPSFGVAAKLAGLAGTMTAVAESDAAPSPVVFAARTWKGQEAPLARPVTVWLVVEAPLPEMSVQAVQALAAVWRRNCQTVIGEPPSPPEVHDREASPSPPVAVRAVGLPGLLPGIPENSADHGPSPMALVARTR